ncbi:MAG: response regulator transcription factor [Oxalicibacterium faecigallinarum]|uniref:response regulator transcription factor n=1 Tax=Oxalicibacterium faecigallinarum TaxID=573741 RepID=UPI0028071408|nr:response regulator transcription factor [Oxalicibacterium faecigallinarum]MDQ7968648.1 response regulator transcription factor [Oxalicibacterium faecigallinarum]
MKCLIVDDHPIMRLGIRQLIVNKWSDAEVGEADSVAKAVTRFAEIKPDIVILDLSLPDVSGTEGVAKMLRVAREVPILVLSLNAESVYAARVLQMGAVGYLPKDLAAEELVTAIERILAGKRYVTPSMADRLLDILGGKQLDQLPHEQLSPQEYRVMLLLAAGKGANEIGESMHVSAKTVSTYTARILQKTGWKNKIEMTKYCVQHGLTERE